MKRNLFGLLLSMFTLLFSKAQIQLYVSTNGNDNSQGSITQPFRTPERAIQEIEKAAGKAVTIYFREGTYYLQKPIILDHKIVKTKSLLISSYADERAYISAGELLTTDWKPYKNGIYVTPVPQNAGFERFFVNGKLQILARYPDYDATARVFNGTSADAINPERIRRWKNPTGGYVHGLHSGEWGGLHYRIVGFDEKGELKLEGGWQNNRPSPLHKQFRFVENIFEELNAPGEWFLDKEKKLLYYYPFKDSDLLGSKIEVSRFKNSIEIKGGEGNPLSNIEIRNLSFLHNERSFMQTKEPLLRSDWTIYRGGSLFLNNTQNIRITGCQFIDVGGNAIMLSGYNKGNLIRGNYIIGAGASGISFVGETDAVRSPSFRYEDSVPYEQLDKIPGPKSDHYPQQCIAENNLIHDIGRIEKQSAGIQIDIASQIAVRYNSIYNTPRAGINIGDGAFGGHILEFNDVFNTVLETGDHGAFNSWGRDRYWSPSRKYMDSITSKHPELILLDAWQTTVIRNNRFRCDHGWDIDLDDGSSNYSIYNNVLLNGGLKLREGFKRRVENNIMVNNSFHPHVWFKNSEDSFLHNIVMTPYAPIQIDDWGNNIDYNLLPDKESLQAAQKRGTDLHSVFGSVDFINPQSGDYKVNNNSQALAIGFKNFAMDKFGVQIPELKKMATQPEFPALIENSSDDQKITTGNFLNATLKSIDGLGERSAYGLPDENGVVILKLEENSLLKKAGLLEKDVIRTMDNTPVKKLSDLMNIYQVSKWKGKLKVEVIRNQHPLEVDLLLQ
ncbi:peptide-binding protein [Chryseobacterium lactis]|uniref:PDZ domain-containing protein n=1 Tax=Chryseobacterium lactis TaxID=1241981 RepID=A0A3G6RKY0_CHRLC|nr:PDZ domain-containing protein [Chryseobacterium lactis]AZA82125.1 PDZ domain-containing protein [Chryseobacterium lactis]AZB02506.1 PDZ domain-containing protein [Chryseobacterium lactis]PNW14198.1 peptide-binding protein [Chryseobacterium lactis]